LEADKVAAEEAISTSFKAAAVVAEEEAIRAEAAEEDQAGAVAEAVEDIYRTIQVVRATELP
jgi:hypothetical protein